MNFKACRPLQKVCIHTEYQFSSLSGIGAYVTTDERFCQVAKRAICPQLDNFVKRKRKLTAIFKMALSMCLNFEKNFPWWYFLLIYETSVFQLKIFRSREGNGLVNKREWRGHHLNWFNRFDSVFSNVVQRINFSIILNFRFLTLLT